MASLGRTVCQVYLENVKNPVRKYRARRACSAGAVFSYGSAGRPGKPR